MKTSSKKSKAGLRGVEYGAERGVRFLVPYEAETDRITLGSKREPGLIKVKMIEGMYLLVVYQFH
jgi:hypothetical protein